MRSFYFSSLSTQQVKQLGYYQQKLSTSCFISCQYTQLWCPPVRLFAWLWKIRGYKINSKTGHSRSTTFLILSLHFTNMRQSNKCQKVFIFIALPNCSGTFNPLSANPTKWANTQTIRRLLPTNCLRAFDLFVGLLLKGLKKRQSYFLFIFPYLDT